MSRELCKVLRAALRSWSATLRLCLIALAIGTAIALSGGAGPDGQRDVIGDESGGQEASSHRERETTRCGRENLRAIRATTRFRDRTAPGRSGLSGQQKAPPPAGSGFESSHRPDRIRGRRARRAGVVGANPPSHTSQAGSVTRLAVLSSTTLALRSVVVVSRREG